MGSGWGLWVSAVRLRGRSLWGGDGPALWGCVGLWGCRAARGPRTAQPAPQLPHSSPLSFMDITALEMSCMAAYGGPVFPYIALGGYPGQGGCGVMGRHGVTGGAVGGGDAVGFRWGDVGL